MVENDTFTYHVKQLFIDPKSSDRQTLITQEQIRTLELLNHLLANSSQPLVICGPDGIGKSTLLKVLQERKMESWLYSLISGHADLSFDTIQDAVAVAIKQDRRRKLVLMIDDAGGLAPGLINKIIDYTAQHRFLRVIFVLTHDELDIKNDSDEALDDGYLIEIAPLSEQQCGEFLHYLAAKPRAPIAFNDISDDIIAAVYQETQGIPGRIIAGLPGHDGVKQSNDALWILIAAVAALVVFALCTQWFSASKYNIKPVPPSVTKEQKPADVETGAPPLPPSLSRDTQ